MTDSPIETFLESLALTVKVAGEAVPGANVKALHVAMTSYGVEGTIDFWARSDTEPGKAFHETLIGSTSFEVSIDVAKMIYLGDKPAPLAVRAAVVSRAFSEVIAASVEDRPILYRRYTLRFQDALRARTEHHRPSIVYADATLQSVFAEHIPSSVTMTTSAAAWSTVRPLVALALGDDEASFYDWLVWLAERERVHLRYTHDSATYEIADAKPAAETPISWPSKACGLVRVVLAEPSRHAPRLLNSWGDGATTEIENADANAGARRDYLVYTPIANDVEARKKLEQARIALGKPRIEVRCRAVPDVHPMPGDAVELDREEFSANVFGYGRALRTIGVRLDAVATNDDPEHDVDLDATEYRTALHYTFEADDDLTPRLPPYRRPHYPMFVEGRIVSTVGEVGDRTHMIREDSATSLDNYVVKLPLWKKKQSDGASGPGAEQTAGGGGEDDSVEIRVLFTPRFEPGHLYFPAYREARVVLAVDFDAAAIHHFVDWGAGVRLPMAGQGNRILFGKNATSQTDVSHFYVDSKPELHIRREHEGDVGTVTVTDGTIVISTFDEEATAGEGESNDSGAEA